MASMTIAELRKTADSLRERLAQVARPAQLPAPTTDVTAETQLMAQAIAEEQARQRVAQALSSQLATTQAELSRLEAEERSRQADRLRSQVDAGRDELVTMLQACADKAMQLHTLEGQEYSLRGVPYAPQWVTLRSQLRDVAFSNLNRELRL